MAFPFLWNWFDPMVSRRRPTRRGGVMRVLVACEFSGTVRDAFTAVGADAWSCDLLPTEAPGQHIRGDVVRILDEGWDLMVAHPPCTYLANSGVSWLHTRPCRWEALDEAARFFRALLDAPIPHIAIENPIPHKYAIERIGSRPDHRIQPWEFGHPETKATCLWLRGLPPLLPTDPVTGRRPRSHWLSPGPDRWKERSRTLPNIAAAMAAQWFDFTIHRLRA